MLSEMKLTGIVAGVSAVVVGLVVVALWYQTSRLEDANKTIGNQAGTIIGLEAKIELREQLDAAASQFREAFNKQEAQFDKDMQELQNATANKALTAYDDSKNDPRAFADNAHVELAKWMCRMEADGDAERIRVCAGASSEAYLGDKSYVFTITPEVADDYRKTCANYKYWIIEADDDQRESKDESEPLVNGRTYTQRVKDTYVFCDYSITGFTSDGWYIVILPYLNKIEAKLGEWRRWGDEVEARLKAAEKIAKQLSAGKQDND